MNDLSLFCTDDLYEGTNMVQVLFCVQHFMMFSEEHAGHLFKPVPKNEPAEFSNQELEMAMAKIEQAGVDATAFKGLISCDASAVPERVSMGKTNTARTDSEVAAVPSKELALERVEDEEPAESDDSSDKTEVEVQPDVCNQVSELDVENPADDDESNPDQECRSDAGDEKEVTQHEDISMTTDDVCAAEILSLETHAADKDEESTTVIQQVLSDMTSAIEEAEIKAQLKAEQDVIFVQVEPDTPTNEAIDIPEEVVEIVTELTELTEELTLEIKAEPVKQTDVDVEVTEIDAPAMVVADAPAEASPAEKVEIAEPVVEATTKDVENPTEDEELEAKAMAKCTCRCTVM
ncbi:unnamed protein product [Phytophthora fragariaefolia]|uniref:Unnamed protein product n=1 Tax=Phytophthora fragariaefolia TaxID=1490495 RepID=A0A9W6XN74_9STRA|nr:unnamed protein product [Phytophthora fragariaefolia]